MGKEATAAEATRLREARAADAVATGGGGELRRRRASGRHALPTRLRREAEESSAARDAALRKNEALRGRACAASERPRQREPDRSEASPGSELAAVKAALAAKEAVHETLRAKAEESAATRGATRDRDPAGPVRSGGGVRGVEDRDLAEGAGGRRRLPGSAGRRCPGAAGGCGGQSADAVALQRELDAARATSEAECAAFKDSFAAKGAVVRGLQEVHEELISQLLASSDEAAAKASEAEDLRRSLAGFAHIQFTLLSGKEATQRHLEEVTTQLASMSAAKDSLLQENER